MINNYKSLKMMTSWDCMMTMPNVIQSVFNHGQGIWNRKTWIRLIHNQSLLYQSVMCSVFFYVTLSIDRLIAVTYPIKYYNYTTLYAQWAILLTASGMAVCACVSFTASWLQRNNGVILLINQSNELISTIIIDKIHIQMLYPSTCEWDCALGNQSVVVFR